LSARRCIVPQTKHDKIAKQVGKRRKTKYNPVKGADFNASNFAGEVETKREGLREGIRQLQGYKKPSYLIVPKNLVKDAIEKTEKTTLGVMDETGKIRKRSTRKKR